MTTGAARAVQISTPATGEAEWLALREVLESGWLTQGPKVAEFERRFAARHGARHGIAVTSCTTGLHAALAGLGVGPGDEVIVPSFTWVATANAALYVGATPVLVDVDPLTNNICPESLRRAVTPRTKAVIPVHLFGLCADMDAVRAAVPPHVHLLEDCACAAGAAWRGRHAGTLGVAGVFSFHPRKAITTGEGGMVLTNDDALAARLRVIVNHGASISEEQRHRGPKPFLLPEFAELGFNFRMTDLQGAVGLVQLGRIDDFIEERAARAAWYRERLADIPWLRCPAEPEGGRHAWQSFVTRVDPATAPMPRDAIMERLQAHGVSTRPGTHAIHVLAYYRDRYGFRPDDFPGARDCARNTMAIPLHNRMDAQDYDHVLACLREIGA